MKRWGVLIVILFLASCSGLPRVNSLQKLGLHGKVKTAAITVYHLVKKGRNENDTIVTSTDYVFNNRGYIASEVVTANQKSTRCVYKFDGSGSATEATKYNDDTSLCYKAVYRFDKDQRATEQLQYDAHGTLNLRITYAYDSAGNIIEESSYWGENSKLLNRYTSNYNQQHQETERRFYNADTSLVMRATYTYNDKGDRLSEQRFDEENQLSLGTTYTYAAYDKQGNWLRRTATANGIITEIVVRSFTYF